MFSLSFDFSRFDLCFNFKFSAFPLLKGRQNPLSNSKNVKVTKDVIDFKFRKWKLIIRYPSEIKVSPIDPVFSNWVNVNIKVSIINCSTNSKSFKAIYFFRSRFFFSFLLFITLFQLSVGYVSKVSNYYKELMNVVQILIHVVMVFFQEIFFRA